MKRSKVVALLLTAGMTVSSVACGGSGNTTENTGSDNTQQTSGTENTDGKTTDGETGESTDEAVDESSMDYDELSEYVYNQILLSLNLQA